MIQIKRLTEDYSPADGYRILVERWWPAGITEENAHIDEWIRDIAPSEGLLKWFGHDIERFLSFSKYYTAELLEQQVLLQRIRKKATRKKITLVYLGVDEVYNHAVVLLKILR
ncbi:DUF488 family protein [Chitinophaga pendula]|uniref:DUF488 domain-containing protein n=1 Tax=Chitinophaga TaxID=79328 RepID=UPI000BAF99CC|nr:MULTISPECIES: DUF488 family protein [Chitinophaga]ASZ15144.1 hypothetical protein CK934_27660 [Chitinophaga sp. MD30]UCJ07892.1 DUF488 family protein [Chitinophaga pendula]